MIKFECYELEKEMKDGLTLILHFKNSDEFADDFDRDKEVENELLIDNVKDFIKENLPNIKVSAVKVMIGTTLISSFAITPVLASSQSYTNYSSYIVQSGDSLWKIANKFGVTVDAIKQLNNLNTDTIYIGQNLKIPKAVNSGNTIKVMLNGSELSLSSNPVLIDEATYLPLRDIALALGATVWYNADSKTVGINKGDLKIAFIIGSSTARVNGEQVRISHTKMIDDKTYVSSQFFSETLGLNVSLDNETNTVYLSENEIIYSVKSGDTLWLIANRFGTTVTALKEANNLTNDLIYVRQQIVIPIKKEQVEQNPINEPKQTVTEPTITYITHTVSQGEILWNLSIQYGIPLTELLKVNNLTMESSLSIGQKLTIPVHHIPVKPVVSERHGELLDWWTEAQYIFTIGKEAKVTDFETGRTWYVKRTIGANHADSEPLTAEDAAIMKEVWGGDYSWKTRAVIVEVDGRRIAGSMTSAPHSIEYIKDNNFNGHFDIHFLNSTRHSDGQITESHQEQIKIAAGV